MIDLFTQFLHIKLCSFLLSPSPVLSPYWLFFSGPIYCRNVDMYRAMKYCIKPETEPCWNPDIFRAQAQSIFGRPKRSRGMLYKHRCNRFINLLTLFLPWFYSAAKPNGPNLVLPVIKLTICSKVRSMVGGVASRMVCTQPAKQSCLNSTSSKAWDQPSLEIPLPSEFEPSSTCSSKLLPCLSQAKLRFELVTKPDLACLSSSQVFALYGVRLLWGVSVTNGINPSCFSFFLN